MKLQFKKSIIFFLSVFTLCLSLQAQESDSDADEAKSEPGYSKEEPEEIVVIGRKDFCIPKVMQQALNRDFENNYGGVHQPGWVHPDEGKSQNPNNYWIGARNTAVSSIDYKNKSLTLNAGYFHCKTTECESLLQKTPEISFTKDTKLDRGGSSEYSYYSLSVTVEFDEMYNAHDKDVKVTCPEKTCDGVVMEAIPEGRLFYTAIRNGSVTTKRLVVHGGLNSKIVTTGSDVGEFDKCETPEETELPTKKKKSKH